MGCGQTN